MNKNPCIHSCWRSSVGHDHAILESFILFVFGTYQWINKQSCVILGCHKQSSEWCHDWFPISLHVPSLSFRARFWIQSLGRHKRYTANLDGRMYGNFFFQSGDKTTHLVAARRRDVVFRATKAAFVLCHRASWLRETLKSSRNFLRLQPCNCQPWIISCPKIGPSTWRCHENYQNKMDIGGPIGNAKACHEDKAKALRVGYTSLKTQWGQYHWSWLSLVYTLPQAVAFERKLRSWRILWFDVDISKIVGHEKLPFHSRRSLPFASTFVGKSLFWFPEPWWSEDRKTTSSIL